MDKLIMLERELTEARARTKKLEAVCIGILEVLEHNDPWTKRTRENGIKSIRHALEQPAEAVGVGIMQDKSNHDVSTQIFTLARDLLEKYAASETTVIWERSGRIAQDQEALSKEIEQYRTEINQLEVLDKAFPVEQPLAATPRAGGSPKGRVRHD